MWIRTGRDGWYYHDPEVFLRNPEERVYDCSLAKDFDPEKYEIPDHLKALERKN